MCVRLAGDNMKPKLIVALILSISLMGCVGAFAQEPIPVTKNYVAWAREFLRTMYPTLNGKGYTLTPETASWYDQPGEQKSSFNLYVGKGAAYADLRFVGGYFLHDFVPGKTPPPPRPVDYYPGWQHPHQLLEAGFTFDDHDRLKAFGAFGPAVGDIERAVAFAKQVQSQPELEPGQVADVLTLAGAVYGPNDKDLLVKNFPFEKLGRFLGKLTIVSVGYQPLAENRDNADRWPLWEVTADAKQPDGTVITYKLRFEPFKGDLLNIWTGQDH